MRLGRLAAAGLIAGALVAFTAALLVPRRRSAFAAEATGGGADHGAEAIPRHVDLTAVERVMNR